jgi:4'-phosphopantetheinyl transferase
MLSADEQTRAERFYFPRDQQRFIIARGLLRVILSRYLGMEPGDLRFCYNPHGKPALAPECGRERLRFNLSHSHEHVVYAVTREREIGIDLEHVRVDLADRDIAARYFSPREAAALAALPPELQRLAFFNCWTRKEAYIKASGQGLLIPLHQFDVSLAPGEPAALLSTQWNPQEAGRWSLRALTPGPDYVAALAVEGHHWQLRCWHYSW